MKNTVVSFFFSVFVVLLPGSSFSLDFPRGPIILTLLGAIERSNYEGKAVLDGAMLRSLPQRLIETDTPWTNGIVSFEGPLLNDVLTLVGAKGSIVKAKAINDYFVSIPVSDVRRNMPILAMRMNGSDLTVRTKGPLWLIYPWKENDLLRSEIYYSRSIWQLESIEIM